MNDRVLMRFDASLEVGRGHATRCLALAETFQQAGWEAVFLCRDILPTFRRTCAEQGIVIHDLDSSVAPEEEPEEVARQVRKWQAKTLVIDSYVARPAYLEALKGRESCVMYFDDLTMSPPVADIVINGNAGAEPQDYGDPTLSRARILAGPQYAVLRPEILRHRGAGPRLRPSVHDVLVMLGSAGTRESYRIVLDALARCLPVCRILLAHWDRGEVVAAVSGFPVPPSLDIQVLDNPPNLLDYMATADVAITAGGVSSLELACMGVPMILFQASINQASNVRGLVKAGAAVSLGAFEKINGESLGEAIRLLNRGQEARLAMSNRGRTLVDGQGRMRVVGAVRELVQSLEPQSAF